MVARGSLFDHTRRVHLVGAGGVGVSALAQALIHGGHGVSGSDARDGVRTRHLADLGVHMSVGHASDHVPADADLVITTAAVAETNPEVRAAHERGIHVVKYAEALGHLMRLEHGVAVAGTHGKTTTTGLLATVLVGGELDPTVVLGGDLPWMGGNFRAGDGGYFVAEACEFDRSFLQLRPSTAIVTNVDADHLDYYRDLDEISEAFRDFARLLPEDGFLATLNEHERVFRHGSVHCKVETFGLRANADWVASDWRRNDGMTSFRVQHRGRSEGVFRLRVPGLHNILNCLGVLAASRHLGLSLADVRPALEEYNGVVRRMQVVYERPGIRVIDDFAHHPSELQAVLSTLREEHRGRRVLAVFQPHQASRTRRHLRAFADALKHADRVYVPDIYFARDSADERQAVHALDLVRTAANCGVDIQYVEKLEDVASKVLRDMRFGDVIVTMGAGNVGEVSRDLVERLRGFDSQIISA